MAAVSTASLATPKPPPNAANPPPSQIPKPARISFPWKTGSGARIRVSGRVGIRPVKAAPDRISEKVEESIKNAEEACSEDPASGECAAAWDEVEELSAAASHARDRKKETDADPLEAFCKDNPETEECRTYED